MPVAAGSVELRWGRQGVGGGRCAGWAARVAYATMPGTWVGEWTHGCAGVRRFAITLLAVLGACLARTSMVAVPRSADQ